MDGKEKEEKKVPKLRFPGFTGEWEKRKAGDLAEYSKGSGYSKEDLAEAGTPIILYGRLYTKYQFAIDVIDTFTKVRPGAILSEGKEVIIPASGETAEEIARASAVRRPGVLLGGDLNVLRPFESINPMFLALVLSNGRSQKELAKRAQGKSVVHIHNSDIREVDICFPTKEEQDQIVNIFVCFDNLIRLHKRRLEHLQELKKGLLQKMFPKAGSKVPEIRFPGFTGEWEQCKLRDEASEIVAGGDIDKEMILDEGRYPVIANTLSNEGIVGYYDSSYRIKAPAVTVTGRGDIGHAKARMVDFTPVVRLLSIKTRHHVFFLENAINTLRIVVESTGVPQLTVPQLAQYELSFPQALEEEEAIGNFFQTLDQLIHLYQRNLDHLKKLKKGLLQQMFV